MSSVHDPLVIRHQGAPRGAEPVTLDADVDLVRFLRSIQVSSETTRGAAQVARPALVVKHGPRWKMQMRCACRRRGSGAFGARTQAARHVGAVMRQHTIRHNPARGGAGSGEERERVDLCSRSITMTETQESPSAKPVSSGIGAGWGVSAAPLSV